VRGDNNDSIKEAPDPGVEPLAETKETYYYQQLRAGAGPGISNGESRSIRIVWKRILSIHKQIRPGGSKAGIEALGRFSMRRIAHYNEGGHGKTRSRERLYKWRAAGESPFPMK